MKTTLLNRMKSYYENITRYFLPRRTYTIIRIDGKAFHTYTSKLQRPFDIEFVDDMNLTALYLCENIQGAEFAYVQSDEISILLTDFKTLSTSAWFNGNIQKVASISASLATARFNQLRFYGYFDIKSSGRNISEHFNAGVNLKEIKDDIASIINYFPYTLPLACFDSRCFTIPHPIEVANYFICRQKDATRNSIQSVAQSLYSHKELKRKNQNQLQEMIFQKGINWNNYDDGLKRGRMIVKNKETHIWNIINAPIFKANEGILNEFIPIAYQDDNNSQ